MQAKSQYVIGAWATLAALACAEAVSLQDSISSRDSIGIAAVGSPLGNFDIRARDRIGSDSVFYLRYQVETRPGRYTTRPAGMRLGLQLYGKYGGVGELADQFPDDPNAAFGAISYDLGRPFRSSRAKYNVYSPAGAPAGAGISPAKIDLLRELWGRHFDDLQQGTFQERRRKSDAFTLAALEIIHERSSVLDVTKGAGFWVKQYQWQNNAPTLDTANAMLGSLTGDPGQMWEVWSLVYQTGSGRTPYRSALVGAPPPVPIPEPSALVGLTGLVAVLGAVRGTRRFRRPTVRSARAA